MKASSLHELKTELNTLPAEQLAELCLRLAKYKKENKELMSYLLFEAQDEAQFISTAKTEVDADFEEINQSNLYYVKKSLRKILRNLNKYSRYSGSAQTTIELLIYFCNKLKSSGIPFEKSPVLVNLYKNQLKKIEKAINTLHEDLQYDYGKELSGL